ncbi:MAG: M56 family metallopeptidase [Verrucomicrobiales bacterium]
MSKLLPELSEWINRVGALPAWIIDFGIKGGALAMLFLFVLLAMRKASASAKSVALQIAMVALLLLPMLTLILPSWTIQYSKPNNTLSPVTPSAQAPVPTIESVLPPVIDVAELPQRSVPATSPAVNMGTWIAGLWALGCLLVLARLAASWLGVSLLGSRSTKIDKGPLIDSLNRQKAKLGLSRKVILLISARRSMPMTWGTFRPRILLPEAAEDWSREQLDTVLLHELAHIRRADCLAQCISQLACAVHWFNPLVWVGAWRQGAESERATDDLVIASGTRPSEYAKTLLEIVAAVDTAQAPSLAAVAMARARTVEKRIRTVLDSSVNRKRPTIGWIVSGILLAGMLLAPLAMVEADEENGSPVPVVDDADSDPTTLLERLDGNLAGSSRLREVPPQPAVPTEMDYNLIQIQLAVLEPLQGAECISEAIYGLGIKNDRLQTLLRDRLEAMNKMEELQRNGLGDQHPESVRVRDRVELLSSTLDKEASTLIRSLQTRLELVQQNSRAASRIRVATPISGIVKSVAAKQGQEVDAGEILLQLDPSESDGKISLLKQELTYAQQSLALKMEAVEAATTLFDRAQKARAKGVSLQSVVGEAQKELRQARSAALLGESELKTAELRLNLAEKERERLTIRAPMKGRILDILCHPGEYVSPSSPVVFLEKSSTPEH